MPSIGERLKSIVGWMKEGPTAYPTAIAIPSSRVVDGGPPPELARDASYLTVKLNQLRLASGRKWWVEVEPMALVVTELTYDGGAIAIPFVVGPSMIKQYGHDAPKGMLFDDTTVAGPYPYKGGRIALTTILYEVPTSNDARQLLDDAEELAGVVARRHLGVVEGVSSVIPAATSVAMYLKVAEVVLDGVEGLLGLNGVRPVTGRRHELDPDFADDLGSGYFAVVNQELDPTEIGVHQRRLVRRDPTTGDYPEVEDTDHLLYRLQTSSVRGDVQALPFYGLIREAEKVARSDASDDGWKRAKALMTAGFSQIVDSPDLTRPHGDALREEYRERLKALRVEALADADMSGDDVDARRAAAMAQVADTLDLDV